VGNAIRNQNAESKPWKSVKGIEESTKTIPNTSSLLSQPSSWRLTIKFPPSFGILAFPVRPAKMKWKIEKSMKDK
jgi:hypothetical protein